MRILSISGAGARAPRCAAGAVASEAPCRSMRPNRFGHRRPLRSRRSTRKLSTSRRVLKPLLVRRRASGVGPDVRALTFRRIRSCRRPRCRPLAVTATENATREISKMTTLPYQQFPPSTSARGRGPQVHLFGASWVAPWRMRSQSLANREVPARRLARLGWRAASASDFAPRAFYCGDRRRLNSACIGGFA